MKMLFVYNPISGKGKIKEHLNDIINLFNQAKYRITIYATQGVRDAYEIVKNRELQTYDVVVCSGGDGTFAEVVAGMMDCEEKLPVGYIPLGTTNDFAKTLNISFDVNQAVQDIVHGKVIDVDNGYFNDRIFVYIAAFGLFTEVSYQTDQNLKNSLGYLAYILEGFKSLSSIRAYKMKVIADNDVFEGEYIYGMITNSKSVAGMDALLPENVALDDGLFEVTLIEYPKNIVELNEILHAVLGKKENQHIHKFKTSSLEIESEQDVSWTLDGEVGGIHRNVQIRNNQKALSMIVEASIDI